MKSTVRGLVPGLLLALLLPVAGEAQGVRLIPWVGLYAPTSDLGEASADAVAFGEKESTLAFGATVEFGRRDEMLGFRIGGAYASESEVPIDGVGCTDCARNTVLAATADLVFRPLPRLLVVQPYALGGAGVKRYSFEFDQGAGSLVDDQSKFTGHIGVGAQLSLGIVNLNVEISDYVSGIELGEEQDGKTQHDLFFTAGLVF